MDHTTCMVIREKTIDDKTMRPSSSPDVHWSQRLVDSYTEYDNKEHRFIYPVGVKIEYQKDEIVVTLTPDVWKHNEEAFEGIMMFVTSNDLTYEFPNQMGLCARCVGHGRCLANNHFCSIMDEVEESQVA